MTFCFIELMPPTSNVTVLAALLYSTSRAVTLMVELSRQLVKPCVRNTSVPATDPGNAAKKENCRTLRSERCRDRMLNTELYEVDAVGAVVACSLARMGNNNDFG